jgi:CRP-like cAMP-binding protein
MHHRPPSPRLLSLLPSASKDQLMGLMSPWRAPKGAVIFHQGEPMHALIWLVEGYVRHEFTLADGRHMIHGFNRPGESIGDLEIFAGTPAHCTAIAQTRATGWRMETHLVLDALHSVPGFAPLMLTHMARFAQLNRRLYELASLRTPPERLAALLLWLSARHGECQSDPAHPLLQISQSTMARMLALTRQCVSKHLGQWAQDGLIELRPRGVNILDRQALSALITPHAMDAME